MIPAELLEDYATPVDALEQFYAGGQLSLDADPSAQLGEAIDVAEDELRRWDADGIRVVTLLDEDYPLNLRTVHDCPPLLTFRGRLAPEDERSVAVVGARSATGVGLARATEVSTT